MSASPDKNKVDILIVDDREDGLLALEMVLDSPDYRLVKARSGLEALSLLSLHDFAVVLLDVQMPGIDGFETAKRIRADEKHRSLPLIFVTAISKELHYVYDGYGSGAVDYLFKPIDPVVLRSKVAIFADLYRKDRKLKEQAELILESERKSHLLSLAEMQLDHFRRYQNLADAVPHIIWKAKPDGTVIYFNIYWCAYTGLSLEHSDDTAWRAMYHPSDLSDLLDRWQVARESGRSIQLECRIKRHDGVYRWHFIQIVSEKDSGGKFSGWIGTCTDIHDRKEKEEQIRLKAEELSRLNEDLRRSNKELEQFAYVASHDLQEPLRMVSNYVDLLAINLAGNMDEDIKSYLKFACEGALRSQQLIRDILTYAKIGPKERQLVNLNFNQILDKALLNLKLSIDENGIEVTHDELPQLMADETQMVELLQNLISNAIKFRRTVPLKIHVGAYRDNKNWVISVKDNGIGIESQYQQRIFGIFQRLHRKPEYPGTGIGLAICKKIVERYNGKIWVESRPGEGSMFCFSLPQAPEENAVEQGAENINQIYDGYSQ